MATEYNISDVISGSVDQSYVVQDDIGVIDKYWISSRFMVSDSEMEALDAVNRYFTTNQYKFTNTSLGGNIGINVRPQYTRYCDIRNGNRLTTEPTTILGNGSSGMGRYYSEAIDDNAQLIFMEFGVPKFNSLLNFFTRAIDYEDSYVANTGRLPTGYKIGKFIGNGVMLAAFPLITVTIWAAKIINRLVIGNGNFDYYYLEPTMHTYWGAVNNIVTTLATELGILIPEFMNDGSEADKIGVPVKINQDDLEEIKAMYPHLIVENNYIDVFAIATRMQSVGNVQMLKDRELYEEDPAGALDYVGYIKERTSTSEKGDYASSIMAGVNKAMSFKTYLDKIVKGKGLFSNEADTPEQVTPAAADANADTKFVKDKDGSYPAKNTEKDKTYIDRFVETLDATVREGGLYAAFYVNYTGSVSESFSNSVGNINLSDKLKGVSGGARNVKFDLAGGDIAGPIKTIVDSTKNVLAGTLDSVTFGLSSVIQTLTGNAYVDVPKKWEESEMSLPSITYEMQLISPYNNVISQMQNIYIPLSMMLAGTLPLSAGKSSYTSPFICSLFSKGIQNIKLGMITSLSITRGTSNLGFSRNRKPLAIDVSFTVTDFSTRMTAPVSSSVLDVFNVALNDDTPLGNYLAVLASRDLLTNKYTLPKVKLRASRALMKFEQSISPSAWALRTGESLSKIMGGVVSDHHLILQQVNK